MDRSDGVGMITGFLVALIIMFLTRSNAYIEAQTNFLFVILLLFATTMLGYGVSRLYISLFGKSKGGY